MTDPDKNKTPLQDNISHRNVSSVDNNHTVNKYLQKLVRLETQEKVVLQRKQAWDLVQTHTEWLIFCKNLLHTAWFGSSAH